MEHYCRFCTGKNGDIQLHSVASGAFSLRTKELHQAHVKQAQDTGTACCGVKKECVFTKNLSHFNVIFGYPPDLAHDVLSLLNDKTCVTFNVFVCLQSKRLRRWGLL